MTELEELRNREKVLMEQVYSDACLITSLNRHIETLETKLSYQADMIKDFKQRLKDLLAKPKHQSKQKKRPQ